MTTAYRKYTASRDSLKEAELGVFAVVFAFIVVMTLGVLDEIMSPS
ncbi:MAG: hypothetical protein H0T73_09950 [Ardenticatenales bacterium]|nr:hypothetical protein [Ardenticatenales bacterium]